MKSFFHFLVVATIGALLGSFLGKLLILWVPAGAARELFSTELTTGLHPSTLGLGVMDITLGCIFRFNITSVLGIILAAVIYKRIVK